MTNDHFTPCTLSEPGGVGNVSCVTQCLRAYMLVFITTVFLFAEETSVTYILVLASYHVFIFMQNSVFLYV